MARWVEELAETAPDLVSAWSGIDEDRVEAVRREVRRRTGPGSVDRLVPQLAALAMALTDAVEGLPSGAFDLPANESDWNVAQAIGHVADARAGLVVAASLAASGRWPATAPEVAPGVPGPADADHAALVRRIATSQRVIERSARRIVGHEEDECPLDHPVVGRLRCGEWLLFAGVHDLMHLEQLDRIAASVGIAR